MDGLDIRILRAMGLRPFRRTSNADAIRPANLARAVGTTVDTVKERIARLEAAGVLAGYEVIPNLRHLGVVGEAYLVRAPTDDTKEAVLAEASAVERILEVHDFLGGAVCVDFAYADDRERERVLARLHAITGARPLRFYGREQPDVPRPLTPLDWRILRAMRGDARRAPSEVAERIGVSAKTVKRRFERMADERSVFVYPKVDPSKAGGVILFKLLLHLDAHAGPDTVRGVSRALDAQTLLSFVPESREIGSFDVVLVAENAPEIDRLRREALAVPGVVGAEPWLLRGYWYRGEWIDGAMESLSSSTTATRESVDSSNGDALVGAIHAQVPHRT